MPFITITLTDAQIAAFTVCENAKVQRCALNGQIVKAMTAQEWAQMHINAVANNCITEAKQNKALQVGITSINDLSESEIEAIKQLRIK